MKIVEKKCILCSFQFLLEMSTKALMVEEKGFLFESRKRPLKQTSGDTFLSEKLRCN